MSRENRAIYLSLQQLYIILYQRKAGNLILPRELEERAIDRTAANEALAGMVSDRVLVFGQDGELTLTDEVKREIDLMEAASRVYVLGGRYLPLQYLYRQGDEALILNVDSTNPDMVRLQTIETRTFFEDICDYEFMPSDEQLQIEEPAPIEDMDEDITELVNKSNILFVMDVYVSGNAKRQRRVCILRGAAADELLIQNYPAEKRVVYSRDGFISTAMEEIW